MSMTPRILAVTPRYRRIAAAETARAAMLDAAGVAVDWIDMIGDQPYGSAGPGPHGNRNILHLYTRARDLCLASGYTHLLTIEDDMLPPSDALPRLLAADAPVVYSLYCWRRADHPWSLYRVVFEDSGDSWLSARPHIARQHARDGAVVPVAGLGLGCTLIRRDALAAVPWRLGASGAACDWYFAVDCQTAGVGQVGHFGVACGHVLDARVIWPDAEAPDGYRYEVLP